jgi:cold shock CspA family protein
MSEHGTITVWVDDRGYGFVRLDSGGPTAFVHISDVARGDTPPPVPGEGLSCALEQTPKGLRARLVTFDSDVLREAAG